MNLAEAASLRGRLTWYATAAAGPMASAAAQFLLSLLLLAQLPAAGFGQLSFLFVASQFSVGIWSALFTSPLLVLSARADTEASGAAGPEGGREAERELRGVRACALLALAPAAIGFAGTAHAIGLALMEVGLYAVYAALVLLRQTERVRATALGRYRTAMLSDLAYSMLLLAGVAALTLLTGASASLALGVLAASVLGGMAPFVPQLAAARWPAWRLAGAYGQVWRRDARWSLLGVVSTEATVNSHSYIVTVLLGPAAFAPIAATVLVIRPITVVINALVEFERARASHRVARGEYAAIASARRHMRWLLLAVWLGTGLVAGVAIALAPVAWFAGKFGMEAIVAGTLLWLGVALARLLHAPEGVILLAAGRFRQLAAISMATAGLSVAAVVAILLAASPVYSIAGIVVGEGAFAWLAWRAAGRLLRGSAAIRQPA